MKTGRYPVWLSCVGLSCFFDRRGRSWWFPWCPCPSVSRNNLIWPFWLLPWLLHGCCCSMLRLSVRFNSKIICLVVISGAPGWRTRCIIPSVDFVRRAASRLGWSCCCAAASLFMSQCLGECRRLTLLTSIGGSSTGGAGRWDRAHVCHGVGDKLDLGHGTRMLQCGGVDQSLFCVLKSFVLGLAPMKNSRFSHQIC